MAQGMLCFKWTEEFDITLMFGFLAFLSLINTLSKSNSYFHSVSLWKYEVLNVTLSEGDN